VILILTVPADENADLVVEKLQGRGAEVVRFNPAQFPAGAEVSLGYSPAGCLRRTLRADGRLIDLERVTAVWHRRPEPPVPHAEVTDPLLRDYVRQECRGFLHDVWNSLDCLVVPGPHHVILRAQLKASQLKAAAEVDFEIPPTLFSTSPADFLDFYRRHNGNVVSKLTGTAFFDTVGREYCRYTEVVSRRDVGYAQAVRFCPVIFQAYVPKRLELRITVVGRQVFAAEIHSQHSNHTRHDWRRYDLGQTPHFPHDLPAEVERRCVELVARLGLCYGAIDMVVTPDGRYVFLEINPSGQYLWIERLTGLPITDAICDLLLSGRVREEEPHHLVGPLQGDVR
jgi:hypothetical protein